MKQNEKSLKEVIKLIDDVQKGKVKVPRQKLSKKKQAERDAYVAQCLKDFKALKK